MNEKFTISFWGYRGFDQQDTKETVKMWKDAGFNIVLSFIYRKDDYEKVKMIELLDECAANGLKVILYDDRIHCHRLLEMEKSEYEKAVQRSVNDFGNHPASIAFFISDEPNKDTIPIAEEAARIVNRISPIPALVNFFPVWRSKDYIDLLGVPGSEIDKLYIKFIQNSRLRCLAYDCYGAMHEREKEAGIELYFDNLNTYYCIAKAAGVPLWTSLLCTGHWAFRQPSLQDMRWQLATAVAHGVKGVQWFMLYDNDDRMGDSPVDIDNEKQPSYYDLRKVNREFMRTAGELVGDLALEEVYHFNRAYGGTQQYAEGYDKWLKSFSAKYNDDAVISRFRHKITGNSWYMFVNSGKGGGNYFKYVFRKPYECCSGEKWLGVGEFCFVELR